MEYTERYLYALTNSISTEIIATEAPINYLKHIYDIESLCEALFIMRNDIKHHIYGSVYMPKVYFNYLTNWYIVIDKCFFLAFDYLSKNTIVKPCILIDDRRLVEQFYFTVLREIEKDIDKENNTDKNQPRLTKQEADSFYNRSLEISSMHNDLNTYKIKDTVLVDHLNDNNLTSDKIFQSANTAVNDIYYKGVACDIITELQRYCQKNKYGIFKLDKKYYHNSKAKTAAFLDNFSADTSNMDYSDVFNFVFCYKYKNYVYVAPDVMCFTVECIDRFLGWGQYKNVLEHYHLLKDNKVFERIKSNYNQLMTYNIADHLKACGYILPVKKDHGRNIPYIEIDAFKGKKDNSRDYGDIDILFYSPYTKVLYLIEFKNYQMSVSNSGSISKDIAKAIDRDPSERSSRRLNKVKENIPEFLGKVKLKIDEKEISEVKAIILTSKPNAYYFRKEAKNGSYLYFDWISFQEETAGKKL